MTSSNILEFLLEGLLPVSHDQQLLAISLALQISGNVSTRTGSKCARPFSFKEVWSGYETIYNKLCSRTAVQQKIIC